MTNISIAQTEYYRRPEDERHASVPEMIAAAANQKATSVERTYNAKDLQATPIGSRRIALVSPSGAHAQLTHWSFGQLARSIGAPASYLRELPAPLASECINYGLQHTPPASDFNLLVEANHDAANGTPDHPYTARAATSETYGRVWDADLYGMIHDQIMTRGRFALPPTWDGKPAGAYRSDRDSFLIIVDGGSIVSDPTLANRQYVTPPALSTTGSLPTANDQAGSIPADAMFRGLIVKNSEVGASSIEIMQILFRYICGNHMLWGAVIAKHYRRRHTGQKTLRDTVREIQSIAFHWSNASAARDEQIIKSLIDHEIAQTRDGVIDELQKIGFTKAAATQAYEICERSEYASPRSFWGLAQGATRASQASGYQDERYALDKLAAAVLARGTRQYATV